MNHLKTLRLQHGYATLRALSVATGISANLLGQQESGKAGINYATMVALSTLYGLPIREII